MAISRDPVPPRADSAPISLRLLFLTFAEITLSSFGGAMAWAYRVLVEKRRWLTDREFAELWSMAQALPGPNIVNLAVFIGLRHNGTIGVVVAFVALVIVPLAVVLPLAALYSYVGQIEAVGAVLRGVAVVGAGMLLSLGVKMVIPLRHQPWAVGVAVLAFVGVGVLRWPLILVLALLTPCSVALAWRQFR